MPGSILPGVSTVAPSNVALGNLSVSRWSFRMIWFRLPIPVSRVARLTSRCTRIESPIAPGSSQSSPSILLVLPSNVSVGAFETNTTLFSPPGCTS